MNRIRPWIAIAMIAVAVLGVGALLVTIYATLPTKTDLPRMTRPLATKADVAQLATRLSSGYASTNSCPIWSAT